MKVIVTSGGTREYIDDVRVMTNVSSGRLGSEIANAFLRRGDKVTYVATRSTIMPASYFTGEYNYLEVKDTMSVFDSMKLLVPDTDVVIQAMAISDFTFDRSNPIKLSSSDPKAFIEYMGKTIKKTPKVISYLRDWNEKAVLVGFKFTVGESKGSLQKIASKLMIDNQLDMVFANDKVHMQKKGDHCGTLIMRDWEEPVIGKENIADRICENVTRVYNTI